MNEFFLIPFFLIALVYSSVGLGGGSSYLAVLSLAGLPHHQIPTLALSLNLIVSGSAFIHYCRSRYFSVKVFLPIFLFSVPAAFLGGMVHLSREIFYLATSVLVFLAGLRIVCYRETYQLRRELSWKSSLVLLILLGSILGFVSGCIGTGGGIFLTPVLLFIGTADIKRAASVSSVFIFLNSISGLLSRSLSTQLPPFSFWIPLALSVWLGGQIGAGLGAGPFSMRTLQKINGVVLLAAALLLGGKLL